MKPSAIASPRHRRIGFEPLEDRRMMVVKFALDFSLDTSGFFNNQGRRDMLSAAVLMMGSRLSDSLDAISPAGANKWVARPINPSTGQIQPISNLNIATDVIYLYVGGRDLPNATPAIGKAGTYAVSGSAAWKDAVKARGETGALAATPTDIAPWGGSLTFDTKGTKWFFGKTTNGIAGRVDFLSAAMHEIGHILGIGSSQDYTKFISAGRFTGPLAKQENANVSPSATTTHLGERVTSTELEVLMDPSLALGKRKLMSQLDLAVLKDLGWAENAGSLDTIYRARHQRTHLHGTSTDHSIFSGRISLAKQVNIYRVWADVGTALTFSTEQNPGQTTLDTYLRMFDGSGLELATADQGNAGGVDTLTFNVTRSDYYYLGVSSYGNRTYNPLLADSGPGGATGSFLVRITMADTSQAGLIGTSSAASGSSTSSGSNSTNSAHNAASYVLPPQYVDQVWAALGEDGLSPGTAQALQPYKSLLDKFIRENASEQKNSDAKDKP